MVVSSEGDNITVSLDTDLPDYTELMMSVSRSYYEKGKSDTAYSIEYFGEKTTVREWRAKRRLSVSDEIFRDLLQERMDTMTGIGEPFEILRITDDIEVSFVVHVNQDNPAFGKGNANLRGTMVSETGLRIIRGVKTFHRPMGGTSEPPVARVAYYASLEVGGRYQLSRSTPLMPEIEPDDPIAAIGRMSTLPPASSIMIKEKRMHESKPWYHVAAFEPGGESCGEGWVNSTALIGQEIRIVE